jgi:hypothetical protein
MQLVEIQTLVDITCTNVVRLNQGTQLQLDQNRNFITLKQCAEIRSIILFDESPVVEEVDIKELGFGTNYKGKHNVWTFKFSPDRDSVYDDENGNSIGELINDIHGVPIIKKLLETVNIDKAVFDCKDKATKNIIIKALQGTI